MKELSFSEMIKESQEGDVISVSRASSNIIRNSSWFVWENSGADLNVTISIRQATFTIKEPKPEMTTWTRPSIVFWETGDKPMATRSNWYGSKPDFFIRNSTARTFGEWETISVPANFKDWEIE